MGTRAHTAIDEIIRGIEPTIEEDIRPVVEGFQNWYAESGLKMHYAGDTTVYSKKYGYAGALDAVATDAEGYVRIKSYIMKNIFISNMTLRPFFYSSCFFYSQLYVVDFKTSNWIQHSYGLQLAAYAYAYAEMANNGLISPPAPKIEGVNASNKHQPKSRSMSTTGTRRVQKEFSESFTNEEEATQDNVAVRRKEPKSNSSIFHSHTAFTMANTGFMGRGIHMSASSGKNKKSKEQNEAAYPISCPGSIPSIPNQVKSLKEQLQGNPFENQSENLEYDPQLIRPMVVRIDKTTGIVEVRRLSDNDSGFSAFKACLYLWRTFHSLGTYSSSGRAPASPLQVGFELPPGAEDQFLPLVQKFQSTSAPPTIPHVTPEEEFER